MRWPRRLQRPAVARQGQVGEPDLAVEEAQPLLDLLEHPRGDLLLLGRELGRQGREPGDGVVQIDSSVTSPICGPAI